jgi:O-antigen ligase
VSGRDGFARPAGTAIHPIEFGVAVTSMLPLAIHRATYESGLSVWRRAWPVAAIALAVPISISRSALVGAITVLVVMIPSWPRGRRRAVLASILCLCLVIFTTIPGMLGTLTGLFTGIATDTSAQSRTDSYQLVFEFVARNPLFGRGFSTFSPTYRILDNEYLLLLIEVGMVGVLSLLAMLGTAWFNARAAHASGSTAASRDLAQSVAASVASLAVSLALFDAFSFPIVAGLLFLMTGIAGATSRVNTASTLVTNTVTADISTHLERSGSRPPRFVAPNG